MDFPRPWKSSWRRGIPSLFEAIWPNGLTDATMQRRPCGRNFPYIGDVHRAVTRRSGCSPLNLELPPCFPASPNCGCRIKIRSQHPYETGPSEDSAAAGAVGRPYRRACRRRRRSCRQICSIILQGRQLTFPGVASRRARPCSFRWSTIRTPGDIYPPGRLPTPAMAAWRRHGRSR